MNKSQLIDEVSDCAGTSKNETKKVIDCFLKAASRALKKGDRVALVGFGSFSVQRRNARIGRNPLTGKEIRIPAKKVVKFKSGADLTKIVK